MNDQPKLGELLKGGEQKDAIHIAIAPVVAGEQLAPGMQVGFMADGTVGGTRQSLLIGVVDPFLPGLVHKGERFWLFLYPQTVTGMRHEWSHPAFKEQATAPAQDPLKAASEKWLHEFADEVGVTYDEVIAAAETFVNSNGDELFCLGFDTPHVVYSDAEKAWHHYEVVSGKPVKDHSSAMFRCAC